MYTLSWDSRDLSGIVDNGLGSEVTRARRPDRRRAPLCRASVRSRWAMPRSDEPAGQSSRSRSSLTRNTLPTEDGDPCWSGLPFDWRDTVVWAPPVLLRWRRPPRTGGRPHRIGGRTIRRSHGYAMKRHCGRSLRGVAPSPSGIRAPSSSRPGIAPSLARDPRYLRGHRSRLTRSLGRAPGVMTIPHPYFPSERSSTRCW